MGEKGVVLEVAKGSAIILTDQGDFKEIKAVHPLEVGQEISLPENREMVIFRLVRKVPKLYAAAGVLLLLAASLLAPSLLSSPKVVAYVGLEMMPSVELGVDSEGRVAEVIAHDQKAKELIANLNLEKKSVSEVAGQLTAQAVKTGDIQPGKKKEVLITVVPVGKEKKAVDQSTKIEKEVKVAALENLSKENIPAQVATVTTDEQVRDQAKELGLSTGKYVILLKAQESGLDLEADDLKKQDMVTAVQNAGGNPQELIDKAQKEGVQTPAADNTGSQAEKNGSNNSVGSSDGAVQTVEQGSSNADSAGQ